MICTKQIRTPCIKNKQAQYIFLDCEPCVNQMRRRKYVEQKKYPHKHTSHDGYICAGCYGCRRTLFFPALLCPITNANQEWVENGCIHTNWVNPSSLWTVNNTIERVICIQTCKYTLFYFGVAVLLSETALSHSNCISVVIITQALTQEKKPSQCERKKERNFLQIWRLKTNDIAEVEPVTKFVYFFLGFPYATNLMRWNFGVYSFLRPTSFRPDFISE